MKSWMWTLIWTECLFDFFQERKDAKAKYSGTGSSTFVPGEMANSSASDFTREQIDKIRDAIKNATTAEAVQKYKEALATGVMPADLQ